MGRLRDPAPAARSVAARARGRAGLRRHDAAAPRLTDRERQFIRRAFDHYLAPALVERLAEDPAALALGGENRELSVLFTDIRGFTSLAERLDPKMVTSLLNGFLTPMTDVLLRNEATIDKYMGDAIMAFWNAPLDIPDHRRKACLAALEMIAALDRLNHERGSKIGMGVGIHTDICCVGNLGSEQRFSYSAIGDGVNLASRVEGLTRLYGVGAIVTDAVRHGAPELAFIEIDRVRVVGRAEPVTVFALMGDAALAQSPAFRAFAEDHAAFLIAYRALDPRTADRLSVARAHAVVPMDTLYAVYAERIAADARPPTRAGLGRHVHDRKEVGECGAGYFGASTITIWRPSERGEDSTFALGSIWSRTLSEQLHADLLVRHFAAAEAHRDLDPVAFLEEALDGLHLGFVVVGVDVGPELDLLDLDHLLALARLGGLLLRGVLEAPEIEELGHRWNGIGGDDDEVEAQFLGQGDRVAGFHRAFVLAFCVDQLNFGAGNILVGLRPFLLGRKGSHGTANGNFPSADNGRGGERG